MGVFSQPGPPPFFVACPAALPTAGGQGPVGNIKLTCALPFFLFSHIFDVRPDLRNSLDGQEQQNPVGKSSQTLT